MRALLTTSLLCLAAAAAWAADGAGSADAVGEGEFPGLQLLPPGTVVQDISLPRYENHRVTALFQAKELCILSRRLIELRGIRGTMFGDEGASTEFRAEAAQYDFTTKRAATTGAVEVTDPRFSARGSKLMYDTTSKRGVLLGPIRTTVSAGVFSSSKSKH